MPSRLFLWFTHKFNPLHVYCRLVEMSLGKIISRWLARQYERFIYSWLSPLVGWLFRGKKDNDLSKKQRTRIADYEEQRKRFREEISQYRERQ